MRLFLSLLWFTILFVTCGAGESFAANLKSDGLKPHEIGAKNSPLAFNDHYLDDLFTKLNRTRKFTQAQNIADQIVKQFRHSDSATIALLMASADEATHNKNYSAALDFLDQIIVLDPLYAEGWNQRATIHYLMGNVKKSMSDISHVLVIEPRHIGALSKMAQILDDSGNKAAALIVWERYLALYPADEQARKDAFDLAEKNAGQKL